MTSKPVIGVTPYRRKDAPFDLYIPEGVRKAVEALGGEVLMFDYEALRVSELEASVAAVDGFIFAGGVDVHPARYGEEVHPDCGTIDEKRDKIEFALFSPLLRRRLPILGICRGCQVINVHFGGTLFQHIPNHRQDDAKGRFCHEVTLMPGTFLSSILNSPLLTNSYHHQSIRSVAPGFTVNAVCADGIIEGMERMDESFILALQWHPESTLDDDEHSFKPFIAFMDAVRAHKNA